MISIHALREEGDLDSDIAQIIYKISIHALREEGDPLQSPPCALLSNFYPRPPRGGRPASVLPWVHASRFLSTPSARRATCPLEPACADTCISIHALREEGDRNRCFRADRSADFYPRPPRGGRPRAAIGGDKQKEISIHALREEGDVTDLGQIKLPYRISIHALREEGDPLPCCRGFMLPDFYPRPPRGGRRARWNPLVLIPVFLSTPSARRATAIDVSGQIGRQISIHALREEGDQEQLLAEINRRRFLSTPSARRATGDVVSAQHIVDISIHALREEGDVGHGIVVHRSGISIHALREEGDAGAGKC